MARISSISLIGGALGSALLCYYLLGRANPASTIVGSWIEETPASFLSADISTSNHGFEVAITAGTEDGCTGQMNGFGVLKGSELKVTDAGDPECSVTFLFDADVATTKETACKSHGLRCGYAGTLTRAKADPAIANTQPREVHQVSAPSIFDSVFDASSTERLRESAGQIYLGVAPSQRCMFFDNLIDYIKAHGGEFSVHGKTYAEIAHTIETQRAQYAAVKIPELQAKIADAPRRIAELRKSGAKGEADFEESNLSIRKMLLDKLTEKKCP